MLKPPGGLPHRANTVENTDEKYNSYGKYRCCFLHWRLYCTELYCNSEYIFESLLYFWSKNCAVQAQGLSGNPRSPGNTCYNITKKSERRYDSSYCMLFETLSKYLIEIKTCLQILFERAKIKMKKADGWGQTQGERRL